jgi:hypothetical protein
MTTPIVMTVTDELVEQLSALTCFDEGGAVLIHSDQVRVLLAERAELKRDAERYRWLRYACDNDPANLGIEYAEMPGVDAAIDAAMK